MIVTLACFQNFKLNQYTTKIMNFPLEIIYYVCPHLFNKTRPPN